MHQKKRIILNVLSNYGGFVTEGVLTFILVGYVIRQLGKESFGLVSLAASLTVMTNFLVTGITQALTKHVAVSIESDNDTLTHELFNTSLLWFTSIGLISAGLIFVLGMFVERLFEIPVELVSVAHCAMFLMALKVLICFPFSSFQGILRAYQRYDLINAARVLAIIVRLGLTILVFELLSKGILQFIVVIILSIVAERILWVVFSVRVGYRPQFKMSYVTKSSLYMLLGFGSIILVINVANLLGYEAVKWVIGSKLSVTDVGAYSLIATLAVQAGSLVRSIANVLMPVASRMQALGHHEKNARLALLSTKYALVISSGLCILPLLLLRPFLLLWVGGEYSLEYISSLAVAGCVLLFGQWFITTAVCLLQMLTGIGKVKFPAMITLTWAVGGLLCVWTYLTLVGDSLLAVVVIISVARFLGAMASLIYGMIQLDVNKSRFVFKAILLPGLAGLITLAISAFVMHYYNVYEVGTFVCVVILLLLIYVALVWSIVLDPMERSALLFRTKQAYVNLRKKIS